MSFIPVSGYIDKRESHINYLALPVTLTLLISIYLFITFIFFIDFKVSFSKVLSSGLILQLKSMGANFGCLQWEQIKPSIYEKSFLSILTYGYFDFTYEMFPLSEKLLYVAL